MGASFTRDLSAFSDGDICHITGVSGDYNGSIVPFVNIDDTFIWDSNTTYSKEFNGVSSNYRGRVTIKPSTGVISMADWSGSAWTANYEVHKLYVYKQNPSWAKVSKAYKKVSGSWVEQSDLTTVFDPTKHYKKGN